MKAALAVLGGIVAIILFVVIAVVGYYISTNNRLVQEREMVKADWGKVAVMCQRRADLIPNLVSVVKGYAAHETDVFKGVAEARAKAGAININAGDIAANPELLQKFLSAQKELSGALTRLMAVSESNPVIKSDKNFLTLQAQIEGAENRIAVQRVAAQNDTREYNTLVQGTLSSLVAGSRFKVIEYFEADDSAKNAPKINF